MSNADLTTVTVSRLGDAVGLECSTPGVTNSTVLDILMDAIAALASEATLPGQEDLVREGMTEHLGKAYSAYMEARREQEENGD